MSVGMTESVWIDGAAIKFAPSSVGVDPESNERVVATLGDTYLYRDVILAGLPDVEERFRSISFPAGGMDSDTERRLMQLLRVTGGFHDLTLWLPERMIYTATEGQALFYLGRRRRDAGVIYDRVAEHPMTVTRNGTAQTVVVVAGASPSVPVSGVCNVATDPVSSGAYRDYSAFALSACAAGDTIEVTLNPVLRVYVERPRVGYQTITEQHDFVFVER